MVGTVITYVARLVLCVALSLLGSTLVYAQGTGETAEESCWQYMEAGSTPWPRYRLCFDGAGTVSSLGEGGGQHGTETYTATAKYSGTRGKIHLELEPTGSVGYMTGWAWPWEFVDVTCSVVETDTTLNLSACQGERATRRTDGSNPPPPHDMVFNRQ